MTENQNLMALFLDESGQLLDAMEALLLKAETAPCLTQDALNTLFRHAHTLKGSFAMMRFAELAETAHLAETLLQALRGGQGDAPAIVSACLDMTGYLRGALECVGQGRAPDDAAALNVKLIALSKHDEPDQADQPGSPAPAARGEDTPPSDLNAYTRIRVFLLPCALPALRAFLVHRAVQGMCADSYTVPGHLRAQNAPHEQIQRDGFELGFTLKPGYEQADLSRVLKRQPFVDRFEEIQASQPAPDAPKGSAASRVSVSQDSVSRLLDHAHELMAAQHLLARHLHAACDADAQTDKLLRAAIGESVRLQTEIGELGMVPLDGLFLRLQRLMRDLLRESGKQADITLEGAEVTVDAGMIAPMQEILMHVARNAVDHGLETPDERERAGKPARGALSVRVRREHNRLHIAVADDGRGIDLKRVLSVAQTQGLLTKAPDAYTRQELYAFLRVGGFTTKQTVTMNAGRGVGLDAVTHIVRDIGGAMDIESTDGQGTRFSFSLPLSLTSFSVVELVIQGRACMMPTAAIERVVPRGTEPSGRRSLLPGVEGALSVLLRCGQEDCCLACDSAEVPAAYLVRPLPASLTRALGKGNVYCGYVQDASGQLLLVLDPQKILDNTNAQTRGAS